jgi:nuclear transport factor 2 (NTF2) superfamily protein
LINDQEEGSSLDTASIIAELEAERDRLYSALAALRGRQAKRLTLSGKPDGRRRKRALSAAARRKIALGMKRRWAERKKRLAA